MKKIFLALALLTSLSRAVDTLTIPTDYLTVGSGTRANLAGDFSAIQTWGNKVRDTLAQVTGVTSGYTGNLLIRSLSNMRLRLDYDNSETARLLVESGNGDSLFTVREDTTARFYKHLTVDSNLTVRKKLAVTDTANFTGLVGAAGGIAITGGTAAAGRITYSASNGLRIRGRNASTWDFSLADTGGTTIMGNPTGTLKMQFLDSLLGVNQRLTGNIVAAGAKSTFGTNTTDSAIFLGITRHNGRAQFNDSLIGGAGRMTGTLTVDTLVSSKFYEESSFTGTLTGCTTSPTGTIRYVRVGKAVTITIPAILATSNSTSATITGMPASIRPARQTAFPAFLVDNGSVGSGTGIGIEIQTDGTITLVLNGATTGFTNSGSKGFYGNVRTGSQPAVETFSYTVQ